MASSIHVDDDDSPTSHRQNQNWKNWKNACDALHFDEFFALGFSDTVYTQLVYSQALTKTSIDRTSYQESTKEILRKYFCEEFPNPLQRKKKGVKTINKLLGFWNKTRTFVGELFTAQELQATFKDAKSYALVAATINGVLALIVYFYNSDGKGNSGQVKNITSSILSMKIIDLLVKDFLGGLVKDKTMPTKIQGLACAILILALIITWSVALNT